MATESYTVFRLAEQFLIRAEARAEENKLNDAVSDINVVRNRAGLPNANVSVRDSILNLIQHERQIELFCEWGNRWFDLKRRNSANTILGPIKVGWKPTSVLYPIPQIDINVNPYLQQNAGY